jgi:oligopeptide/dipeptide ABC transporter ATP-binding protein
MRKVRGREISMIMQDPMTSLDPLFNVGTQVEEALPQGRGRGGLRQVIDLLSMVRIPAPEARRSNYPHQLSGGMRQRVVAAISLASEPAVLLADEPTTALDVTVQAQFLALLKDIRERRQLALILVTHDLSVVARACDRAAVMYAGRIVEMAPTRDLFVRPHHPYTQGLIGSVPRLGQNQRRLATIEGQPPDLVSLPQGCAFRARCPAAMAICETDDPQLRSIEPGREVACHLDKDAAAALWRERQAAAIAAREAAS